MTNVSIFITAQNPFAILNRFPTFSSIHRETETIPLQHGTTPTAPMGSALLPPLVWKLVLDMVNDNSVVRAHDKHLVAASRFALRAAYRCGSIQIIEIHGAAA
jgi:hypothetical protein